MCKRTPPGVIQSNNHFREIEQMGLSCGGRRAGAAESVSVALYARSSAGDTEK